MYYYYGMRLRPAAPGAQPKDGLVQVEPHDGYVGRKAKQLHGRDYWNVLKYSRPLTDDEISSYDLDYLGAESLTARHNKYYII